MVEIGRNDACYCGSGKKYKRCCLAKDEQALLKETVQTTVHTFLTFEEVDVMSTDQIIAQLRKFGIPFKQEDFLQDIKRSYSAQEISEAWFGEYRVNAKGRDEDFPWLAAWILWERLAPKNYLSMEQLDDLHELGFDYLDKNDSVSACDAWLQMWDFIKNRNDPKHKTLDHLEQQYAGSFFISNLCQDLEMELHNAGIKDSTYFEKRITYCQEFCNIFSEESELIVHNMRRAIGASYGKLDQYERAESEFERLVQDFPDNPWGYIDWGDLFFFGSKKDDHKAKELYEKAKPLAKNTGDTEAVKERLEGLKRSV